MTSNINEKYRIKNQADSVNPCRLVFRGKRETKNDNEKKNGGLKEIGLRTPRTRTTMMGNESADIARTTDGRAGAVEAAGISCSHLFRD